MKWEGERKGRQTRIADEIEERKDDVKGDSRKGRGGKKGKVDEVHGRDDVW